MNGETRATDEFEADAPPRSAWNHGLLALAGSLAGFAAGALYLARSHASADGWALEMAIHTAAWHLLLVLTLLPASVWGGRIGIRAVQLVAAVFFAIHFGMALSNVDLAAGAFAPWIAALNAASGAFFLATLVYGRRAARDAAAPAS